MSEAAKSIDRSDREPLASRLRPTRWQEFSGLEAIDQALVRQLAEGRGRPPSLVLWGPPGSGKTTFAKLVGHSYDCNFIELSAVLAGVKDVREITAAAAQSAKPTILFVDEIHRFNRGQQDAFLPHVERGTISLIGATTENPSFYLTSALLSRCQVVVLPPLGESELGRIALRAAAELGFSFAPGAERVVVEQAAGDSRRLLNLLESFALHHQERQEISPELLQSFLTASGTLFYDRSGEEHYNVVSAMIKSLRGSDPDAALFWAFKMIESGEDPRFVIRRLMIFASEDIGNADPRALQLAVATLQAFEQLGLPEGRIPLAQCVTYLACAPKSNRSYLAMHAAIGAIKRVPRAAVPLHLRNAPTTLMKELGYGETYQYPHDHSDAFVPGVQYLPDELRGKTFYEISERGYEKNMKERMELLRAMSAKKSAKKS